MDWPQVIYLMLAAAGFGFVLVKHGQQPPPYNIWLSTIANAMVIGILYWGGFFS